YSIKLPCTRIARASCWSPPVPIPIRWLMRRRTKGMTQPSSNRPCSDANTTVILGIVKGSVDVVEVAGDRVQLRRKAEHIGALGLQVGGYSEVARSDGIPQRRYLRQIDAAGIFPDLSERIGGVMQTCAGDAEIALIQVDGGAIQG